MAQATPNTTDVIRDAATVILIRDRTTAPAVLMGQRGAGAAFMPSKVVFPGGAVDAGDHDIALARPLPGVCTTRLQEQSILPPTALAAAAIREVWEETGLILGHPGDWPDPPADWAGFAASGHRPDAAGLAFVFRAITPPGRSRRFDARFFLADADMLAGDPDDLTRASGELAQLQWVPLAQVRRFDLPFITKVVLAEVMANLHRPGPPAYVPFFRSDDERRLVERLGLA